MSIQDLELSGVPTPVARHLRGLISSDGALTVDSVLEDAAAPESPLHRLFVWDDTEAAEKYRQLQARQLISRVKVKVITADDAEPVSVRAFVSRLDIGAAGEALPAGSYVPVETISGATDAEASVLLSIKRDIRKLRRKYSGFELLLAQQLQEEGSG